MEYNVFLMWILSSIYIKLELFIAVTYLVESIVFDKFFFSLPFIFFLLFTIVVNYTCAYLHPSTKNTQFFLLKTYFLLFFVSSSYSDLLFQIPMFFKNLFFFVFFFSLLFCFSLCGACFILYYNYTLPSWAAITAMTVLLQTQKQQQRC